MTYNAPTPTLYDDGQSYNYTEITTHGETRIRIVIHLDTHYEKQSYAHIAHWDGRCWQEIHRLNGAQVARTHANNLEGFYGSSTRQQLIEAMRFVL